MVLLRSLASVAWGVSLLVMGCGPLPPRVTAGGSTFVNPLMQRWAGEYRKSTGVEVDYIKKSSGYGIRQLTERSIVFACSDTPLKGQELAEVERLGGGPIVQFPVALGAIAIVYSLPGIETPLRLTSEILAQVFRGEITRWNDPRLQSLNPQIVLPDREIAVVTRAESSGTTHNLMAYLRRADPSFPEEFVSKKPRWPSGVLAQEGSDGVVGHIKSNPFCLGYVETHYARKNQLQIAHIRNASGEFLAPLPETITNAIMGTVLRNSGKVWSTTHSWTVDLLNAPGPESYPLCGVTYAAVYAQQQAETATTLRNFFHWVIADGQSFARELHYAPLPPRIVPAIRDRINQISPSMVHPPRDGQP